MKKLNTLYIFSDKKKKLNPKLGDIFIGPWVIILATLCQGRP